MALLTRFTQGNMRLGRIEAFSDGVFAIIVTLLVLDLHISHLLRAADAHELDAALLALLPKFLSWLISFVIVCKFWLNHTYTLSLAARADYGLAWLNAIFLMFQSFVPFPTALLGDYPHNPLAITLFGVVMAFNTVLFLILQAYIFRRLLKPEYAGARDPHLLLKSMAGPAGYLLGAALSWWNVYLGFLCLALTPLLFITPPDLPQSAVSSSPE